MSLKNNSNPILIKYFQKMKNLAIPIPYMTQIAKETGLSNATISRFAKKNGYYNFGEMRAKYNKLLEQNNTKVDKSEINELFSYPSVKIVSSRSTKLIGIFLKNRTKHLIDVEIVDSNTKWESTDLTIFTTITSESSFVDDYIKKSKGRKIYITTVKRNDFPKSIKQIVLSDYKIEIRNAYDVASSLLNMMNWLNERINLQEVMLDNKK